MDNPEPSSGYCGVGLIWPAYQRNSRRAVTAEPKPIGEYNPWGHGELDTYDRNGWPLSRSRWDERNAVWTTHTSIWNADGTVTYTITRSDETIYTRTWWPSGTFPNLRKPSIHRRARHTRRRTRRR